MDWLMFREVAPKNCVIQCTPRSSTMLHRNAFGSTDLSVANWNNANPWWLASFANSPIAVLIFVDKTLLWSRPGLDTMIVNLHHDFFEADVVSVSKPLLVPELCIVCTASHDISWIFSKICFVTQNSLQCARLGDKTLWTCAGYSGTWWCQRCGQSCLMLSLLFRIVSSMSKVCQSLSYMWTVQKIHFGLWASWQQDPGAEAQLEPQGLWVSGVTVFDIAVDEDVNCQESRERSCSANLHVTNTKPRLDQRHTQGMQIKQLSIPLFWRCGAKNSRRSLSMLSLWFLAVHAIGWFLSTQVLDLAASGTRCLMHVWFAVYPPVFSSIWQDLGKTEGASRTEQPSS